MPRNNIENISTIKLARIARTKLDKISYGWQVQEIDRILEIIIERLEKNRLDSIRKSHPYPAGLTGKP